MSGYRHDSAEINAMDWFCGAGGSSQGIDAVPGVRVSRAANHWDKAIESHAMNFPAADHWKGDIRQAPVEKWPAVQIFWASPECPKWTNARGKKRDFDTAQEELPGFEKERDPADERSRALMEEVPMYLRGVQERGGLVLAGIVENVIDCRAWIEWDRWLGELHKLGYATKTIALNSMHAQAPTMLRAPQSRDRLYVAYWHRSLGRSPDWNKWLRPAAWCAGCEKVVRAMQVFKKPGADMGRYGIRSGQYVYRCPNTTCRNRIVEPEVLPAFAAIDWSIPGTPIGDRPRTKDAPEGLKPKTIARIRAGLERFAQPVMVPSGGTWRDTATSGADPMPTRTTRENDALAVPPLLIPSEGRDGKEAAPAHRPLRTQTARNETGLAWLPPGVWEPFITPVRGGGDSEKARALSVPLHAVTAGGNHHGLVTPPGVTGEDLQSLLVPYYGNGSALPATGPVGAFTTRDRWALVQSIADVDIQDVLYRMLEPHEIGRGMAFAADYLLAATSKRDRVRLLGNAVTPPAAEILVSALTETITGIELEVAA
ncbi:DNA cytosine methyltransferase [Streptomyces sp. H27-G5]|uniref:DNA cytosine methyltransferase n=1 Tax=Streptomyces sp. H27-G5 TaxID=2996698 RepID=UPI00226DDA50|nr:DNA cytosine methyltransferase [Streptomyces sp. H27-G5]MCY0922331.1 DNA cytosine methyltransferase [Streptomyces sp. H27-G5]